MNWITTKEKGTIMWKKISKKLKNCISKKKTEKRWAKLKMKK